MFSEEDLIGIAFIGDTLSPLFLNETTCSQIDALVGALASLEPCLAADEWPFVKAEEARRRLGLIVQGLADGPDAPDLVAEYRRLLIGPVRRPAPPWGSVYTDRDCVVFGGTCIALREWMRANGVARTGDANDPEDHIGLMLVMLSWLASHRPELVEGFLRDHLLTWSHHFLEQFADAACHPFYEGLARLTDASLEGIRIGYGISVDYPRFYR